MVFRKITFLFHFLKLSGSIGWLAYFPLIRHQFFRGIRINKPWQTEVTKWRSLILLFNYLSVFMMFMLKIKPELFNEIWKT